tara:strand:- start:51360 stop:51593 length:234 start_codon:yes stop_codon:yes gene_type:complete
MNIVKLYHKNIEEGELRFPHGFPNDEDIRQFVIKQVLSKPYIETDYIEIEYKRENQKSFNSMRRRELDKIIEGLYNE